MGHNFLYPSKVFYIDRFSLPPDTILVREFSTRLGTKEEAEDVSG